LIIGQKRKQKQSEKLRRKYFCIHKFFSVKLRVGRILFGKNTLAKENLFQSKQILLFGGRYL